MNTQIINGRILKKEDNLWHKPKPRLSTVLTGYIIMLIIFALVAWGVWWAINNWDAVMAFLQTI